MNTAAIDSPNSPAAVGETLMPSPYASIASSYTIASVPGATRYELLSYRRDTATPVETADNASRVTLVTTAGYDVVQTSIRSQGTSAFNLRHGASGALVAGQYEGNLNKLGETLQIVDGVGESVLEFTYDPLWYGVPKVGNPAELKAVQGYSLVLRSSSPVWNAYENPTSWALSGTAGGTPGANDTSYSNVFVGWRKDYFTAAEELSDPLAAPAADADSDGRSNFEEFVFGGNPRVADNKTQALTSIVNDGGTDYLAVTFERRHNVLDAAFTVEACSDLLDWQPVNHPFGALTPVGNGLDTVTYRDSIPSTSGQRFIRVRAVK